MSEPVSLGRYTLLHPLGRGGMGQVWKATDRSLDRTVAVKVLHRSSPEETERFQREARLAAGLSHPNIAAIYEFGQEGDTPYIAMQYIDGVSLDKAHLPVRRAVECVRDAARALEFAHARGIVHRDLKPSNLMLDGADRLFVMDFGLAKSVKADRSLTASGFMVGTPSYMPPEQAQAMEADARSDVYSLGATLYALLTGRAPFVGDNLLALLADVVTVDPIAPRRLVRGLDRDLETVVLKCLEKDPARRYPTAAALGDDLDRWRGGEPVTARPASLLYALGKRVRRHPVPWALGVLLAVALLAIPATVLLQRTATQSRERADARSRVSEARGILAALPAEPAAAVEALIRADDLLRGAGEAGAPVRFEVNRRLGEVAIGREDFGLARVAFSACRALDAAKAEGLERQVAEAEQARLRQRRDRIGSALDDLRRGLGRPGRATDARLDDYVLEVVRYTDAQTVQLLAAALAPCRERAREAGRDAAWSQEDRDLMAFCFRVLGRLDLDACVAPLAGMMEVLWDDMLLRDCGEALCNTRRAAALPALLAARERIGMLAPAWQHVARSLRRVPADAVREPRTAEDFRVRGLTRAEAGDLEGAIADYTRAVELDPSDASSWNNRASARRDRGDLAGAMADYDRALKEDPGRATAWANRASARLMLGEVEQALADYTRALSLEPGHPLMLANRALAHRRRFDFKAALQDYTDALRRQPRDPELITQRAETLMHLERNEEAVDESTRALEIDAGCAAALSARGVVLAAMGRLEEALRDATRAVELAPSRPEAFVARGMVHHHRGDLDAAIGDFSRALSLRAGNAMALMLRAGAYRAAGDFERARRDFDEALRSEPAHADALARRGSLRAHLGDRAGARRDLDESLRLAPGNLTALKTRGYVRQLERDYAGARDDYERALAISPGDVYCVLQSAAVLDALGDRDAARERYDRALRLDPRNLAALINRGTLRLRQGDSDGAVEDYSRAIEIDPRCVQALYNRSCVRLDRGDAAGALADAEQALAVDGSQAVLYFNRGVARRERGDLAGAAADFETFLKMAPEGADTGKVKEWIAEIRRKLGRPRE
jgi:tetratricopeptide (TPR) repeat protein/predicted Ser/Thr protein kinase